MTSVKNELPFLKTSPMAGGMTANMSGNADRQDMRRAFVAGPGSTISSWKSRPASLKLNDENVEPLRGRESSAGWSAAL